MVYTTDFSASAFLIDQAAESKKASEVALTGTAVSLATIVTIVATVGALGWHIRARLPLGVLLLLAATGLLLRHLVAELMRLHHLELVATHRVRVLELVHEGRLLLIRGRRHP